MKHPAPAVHRPVNKPLAVVAVDDDPDVLDLYRTAFPKLGCRVRVAADSEAALALCRAGRPDVFVVGPCGLEAAAEVCRDEPIPVVFVSGRPDDMEAVESFDGLVHAVLSRPVCSAALASAVAHAVRCHERLTTAAAERDAARRELREKDEKLTAAELLAAAERDRYLDLFEFAPTACLVTDVDGTVREANRAACDLFDLRPRGLLSKPLETLLAADDRKAFREQLAAIKGGRSTWEATLRVVPGSDGTGPRVMAASVVPFRSPDTRRPMLRWQLRDAGHRPQAAAVDASRLRFVAEAAAAFAPLAECDAVLKLIGNRAVPHLGEWCFAEIAGADGPRRQPLVLAQPSHADHLKAASWPAVGFPARPFVVRDTAAPPANLSPSESSRVKLAADLGWPSILWLPLISPEGAFGGLAVGSARADRWCDADVAVAGDFVRLAAAALRNADLYRRVRESDERKGEFVAALAHEMRNPLAPIRNAAQILTLKGSADPDLASACAVIQRQTVKLGRMIDNLLDAARLARGKVHLQTETVDLGQLAEAAAAGVRPQAASRGLRLIATAPGKPIRVEGDPVRLEQVIANLLDNAVKYTNAGGVVTLTADLDGDEAVVRVADTGAGIPPGMLPRVFDLYVQEDGTADRSRDGLGVGLAVVKQLVELHGGTVEVKSGGPGTGSEFVVRLPCVAPQLRSTVPAACPGRTLRFLIVDDDYAAATALAKRLEAAGHRASIATKADQGLRQAMADPPDVAVIAPDLSDVSGNEVARRLGSAAATRGVRVVGYGGPLIRPAAKAEGNGLTHLPKPATAEAIESLVGYCRNFGPLQ